MVIYIIYFIYYVLFCASKGKKLKIRIFFCLSHMCLECDFEINLMLLYLQSVFENAFSDGRHMRE